MQNRSLIWEFFKGIRKSLKTNLSEKPLKLLKFLPNNASQKTKNNFQYELSSHKFER